MHDARAIANFILDEFDAQQNDISNKKINKLIYFCHGFSMLRLNAPLIKNHIEAWAHGPVVKVVYDAFKQFEFRAISGRASSFNYIAEREEIISHSDLSADQTTLVKNVVAHFVKYSADDLEEMSHSQFGPWAKVWNSPESERGIRNRIPDEDIRRYFQTRYGENSPTH